MSGPATEGSVQQRVHRMSVGHDERLVVSSSAYLFYQNTITFPTSFLVSPFVEMSVNDSDLKFLEI